MSCGKPSMSFKVGTITFAQIIANNYSAAFSCHYVRIRGIDPAKYFKMIIESSIFSHSLVNCSFTSLRVCHVFTATSLSSPSI